MSGNVKRENLDIGKFNKLAMVEYNPTLDLCPLITRMIKWSLLYLTKLFWSQKFFHDCRLNIA